MRSASLCLCLVFAVLVTVGMGGCQTCKKPQLPCAQCLPDPGGAKMCQIEIPPPPAELPDYDNLVFCGGGVKGISYGGALKVLDSYQRLAPTTEVAGTSAGSLTALVVSLGLSGEEICELIAAIDYSRFEDSASTACHLKSLKDLYGWYTGDYALCLLECLVQKFTGSRQTTFAELHSRALAQRQAGECDSDEGRCFKDLYVIGTEVNHHTVKVFSWETTPDVAIAEAARISMAIPYFFASRDLDGLTMVDGGVLWNYPISLFDEHAAGSVTLNEGESNPRTLGFHLGLLEFEKHPVNDFMQFTKQVIATILDAQTAQLALRPEDVKRSVFIDTGKICATDFDLTPEQVKWLVKQGASATEDYFQPTRARDQAPDWLLDRLRARQPQPLQGGNRQ